MMVKVPFTAEQVKSLNEFQEAGVMHPFTCGNCRADLVATEAGWICPTEGCDYTQDWAHDFMANYNWHKLDWRRHRPTEAMKDFVEFTEKFQEEAEKDLKNE